MSDLHTYGLLLLLAFVALAAVDGLYFHLWRYRLHETPGSKVEHALHTMRALLFPGIVILLYAMPTAGLLLWAGVALVALDTAVEVADAWLERGSRAPWGGLPPAEYVLHLVLTTLRAASLALVLAARPAAAWVLAPLPALVDPAPAFTAWATGVVLPGAVAIALLHVVLMVPALAGRRPDPSLT